MGAPWREHAAWSVVDRAEAALGEPLSSVVLDAPAEQLTRTRDAQLAVLLTSLVAWEAVRGRMAALLGASLEQAEEACRAAPDGCWIANDNAPGQVVIAGTPGGVEKGSA